MSAENDNGGTALPQTPAEKAFVDETARFGTIKAVQAEWDNDRDALLGNKQPEGTDDATGTENGAEGGDGDTDPGAGDGDDGEAAGPEADAEDDGELRDEEGNLIDVTTLPPYLQKRIERSTAKQRRIEDKEREVAEREVAVAAKEAEAAAPKPAPEPKRDDYETDEEFDEAKAEHEAAKPKPAPLPLGLTVEEVSGAKSTIRSRISASMSQKLGDVNVVKALPHAVLMEIAEQPTKEETERMARFVIGNQPKMMEIAKLPPRRQAVAFREAFTAKPPAERKIKPGAEPPIAPVNGRATTGVNLATKSFADYEAIRNAEEVAARKSGKVL